MEIACYSRFGYNALSSFNTAKTVATEAGDAEIWIAQIVAECVPDGRTNHGERTTAVRVELYSWHDE